MHDSDPISCKRDYYRARLSLRVQVPSICNKRAGIRMARKFFMLFSFLFPLDAARGHAHGTQGKFHAPGL